MFGQGEEGKEENDPELQALRSELEAGKNYYTIVLYTQFSGHLVVSGPN